MKKKRSMKKFISILVGVWALCSVISCGPMDETYKDFIKDGPIMYLTRLSTDSIVVRNGWERVEVSFPIITDGRSSKVVLAMNQEDTLKYDLVKDGRTNVFLNNMREGSVIFSAWLEDEEGNKSLATDFTGNVYGEQYKNYLLNRSIVSKIMNNGNLIIKYVTLLDSTVVASRLTWNNNGVQTTKVSFYNESERDTLNNFQGNTFTMETLHVPDKNVLDSIWSKPVTYTK